MHLDPKGAGLVFQPVRDRLLTASKGGTDFGGLFLGFSFFLIAAALMLVGLLFRLTLDRRAKEVGLLLASGFAVRHVRRLLLTEGLAIAVIGAVYVDAGWKQARDLVLRLLGDRIAVASTGPGGEDFKTRLQEHVARRYDAAPSYVLAEKGPDHGKRFFATVLVEGEELGRGEGTSKKQAEQDAARVAWNALVGEQDRGAGKSDA